MRRSDGRAANEMRPIKLTPDFISTAEGSVLIESGHTRVITTVTVDDGVPGFLKGSGKGLDHQRIWHASALYGRAHAARIHAWAAIRAALWKFSG